MTKTMARAGHHVVVNDGDWFDDVHHDWWGEARGERGDWGSMYTTWRLFGAK